MLIPTVRAELNRKTQQAELADRLMRECEAMETEIAMLKNKRSQSEVRCPGCRHGGPHLEYSLTLPAASDY